MVKNEWVVNGQPIEVKLGEIDFVGCCHCSMLHLRLITKDGNKYLVKQWADTWRTRERRESLMPMEDLVWLRDELNRCIRLRKRRKK